MRLTAATLVGCSMCGTVRGVWRNATCEKSNRGDKNARQATRSQPQKHHASLGMNLSALNIMNLSALELQTLMVLQCLNRIAMEKFLGNPADQAAA